MRLMQGHGARKMVGCFQKGFWGKELMGRRPQCGVGRHSEAAVGHEDR